MKYLRKYTILFFMIAICLGNSISVHAASGDKYKSSKVEKTYAFAVPNGGWSSCKITAIYDEYYKSKSVNNGIRNTFYKRTRWYYGKYAYATAKPKITMCNVIHRDSKGNTLTTFTSWKSKSSIFPGNIDARGYSENTTSKTYSYSTSNQGKLPFIISVSGGMPASQTGSATIKLSTK